MFIYIQIKENHIQCELIIIYNKSSVLQLKSNKLNNYNNKYNSKVNNISNSNNNNPKRERQQEKNIVNEW